MPKMLIKFEAKCNRVKGLAFHPVRPWVLASLHSGSVQLWDYRMAALLARFDEHKGPVRSVAFHPTASLFASGGDDGDVRVWDLKTRRCFVLHGHRDYVRSVSFHSSESWVLSCSDDQTIRVWNWQNRNCAAILTGHSHYVMCAQFHPRDDLIVSASLDFTIRVWDISGLRRKSTELALPPDLFVNADYRVKCVLEGHDRGVNWVAFHPTLPLIVSGADDRLVKVWQLDDNRAWLVNTYRGHINNVSSVVFANDYVLSNSEDKTVRVWDGAEVACFKREFDRFWVLTSHPSKPLFAAGHDTGMMVFKLHRERPCACVVDSSMLFFIKHTLYEFKLIVSGGEGVVELNQGQVKLILPNKFSGANSMVVQKDKALVRVATKPFEKSFSLFLVSLVQSSPLLVAGDDGVFAGSCVVTIKDNLLRVFDSSMHCTEATLVDAKFILPANNNFIIAKENSIEVWDCNPAIIKTLPCVGIKYCVWSKDGVLALYSKHTIYLYRDWVLLATVHETLRIKSAIFDDNVLLYATIDHLRFALSNGDSGIICSLLRPLYLYHVQNNLIVAISREKKIFAINYDATEYKFKAAVVNRNDSEINLIVQNASLVGHSIISFLMKRNYPEIASHFVSDPSICFELALDSFNLEAAQVALGKFNCEEKSARAKLVSQSLMLGNLKVAEPGLNFLHCYSHLAYIYFISGNKQELQKLFTESVAQNRANMESFLFLGNFKEMSVEKLIHPSLAAMFTKTYSSGKPVFIGPAPVQLAFNVWPCK